MFQHEDATVLDCLALQLMLFVSHMYVDYWRRDERFLSLVRNMNAANKLIATICHGNPSLHCFALAIKVMYQC